MAPALPPPSRGYSPLIGSMFFQAPTPDEAERFLSDNALDALEISLPINSDHF